MNTSAPHKSAAFLIIGNEILSGRTQDKNLSYVANALSQKHIPLKEVRVVRDEKEAIIKALTDLCADNAYVFTSGGIGPTHDDITTQCVAAFMGKSLTLHREADQTLRDYYKERINEARLKMAMIPSGCVLLPNPISAAPGFHNGQVFVCAGIPSVFQAMVDYAVQGLLEGKPLFSETIVSLLGEGDLTPILSQVQHTYPSVEIGSYPRFDAQKCSVSIVFRSHLKDSLKNAVQAVEKKIAQKEKEMGARGI
jgi:molybdopterin-biosynthesis enzyme MoeA-like protein